MENPALRRCLTSRVWCRTRILVRTERNFFRHAQTLIGGGAMKRMRYSDEEIVGKLRQAELLIDQGRTAA